MSHLWGVTPCPHTSWGSISSVPRANCSCSVSAELSGVGPPRDRSGESRNGTDKPHFFKTYLCVFLGRTGCLITENTDISQIVRVLLTAQPVVKVLAFCCEGVLHFYKIILDTNLKY